MSRHNAHLSTYLKSRREKKSNADTQSSLVTLSHGRHGDVKHGNRKLLNGKQKPDSQVSLDHILPPEIISKIFSFLTPSEILICARVCKTWSNASNEISGWLRFYNRIPRSVRDSILPKERTSPNFHWKSEIMKRTVIHRNKKVKTMIKKINPYSGLPAGIEQGLRFLSTKLQLSFTDKDGKIYIFLSDMYYFSTSLTARWCTLQLPFIHKLKSMSISAMTAVFYHRDWKPHTDSATRKSLLMSFELKDLKLSQQNCTSEDEMITLHVVKPGTMLAVWKSSWKDGGEMAFVSVSLHYHQLIERILKGTRQSIYRPLPHQPLKDDIDPLYGLQRYSATVELRNQRKCLWGNHYRELYQKSFDGDCLVLESHEEQEGIFNVKTSLPWKTAVFKNILSDMVILDLTLLDEHKVPMWCISSPVKVVKVAKNEVDYTFLDGECSLVEYRDNVGQLRIHLVWIEEDRQNLVKSLEIHLRKDVINAWFGTNY